MGCENCGAKNQTHAQFCKTCGKKLSAGKDDAGSVDLYFKNKENTCQHCGKTADLKKVIFYKNIGMVFQRSYQRIEGRFCRNCIDDYFWNFTLTTLFLGWWGTISFFVTPIYLLNNTGRYLYSFIDK